MRPQKEVFILSFCALVAIIFVSLVVMVPATARGQATYFGPTPYLSEADVPAGLYAAAPVFLEDFEDGTLDGGITSNPSFGGGGARLGSSFGNSAIDSVDGDDGLINGTNNDGAGNFGESWWTPGSVTFTFPSTVVAAGVVWTDGGSGTMVTFEAFGPGMVSLGVHGPFGGFADASNSGGTAEDRFFGVSNPSGIIAITLENASGGLESDHVQYGAAVVPTLSQWGLIILGLLVLSGGAVMIWRRRNSAEVS